MFDLMVLPCYYTFVSGNTIENLAIMKQDASKMMYMNVFSAIPFFRNLGGFERVEKTYTKYGLIPYTLNSVNPDRTEKTVRTFYIK